MVCVVEFKIVKSEPWNLYICQFKGCLRLSLLVSLAIYLLIHYKVSIHMHYWVLQEMTEPSGKYWSSLTHEYLGEFKDSALYYNNSS